MLIAILHPDVVATQRFSRERQVALIVPVRIAGQPVLPLPLYAIWPTTGGRLRCGLWLPLRIAFMSSISRGSGASADSPRAQGEAAAQ
jgi:hypothetical protein